MFLPHGFSDEEFYQIEEAVKLLIQCNGVVNGVAVKIEKNKLKQADLKNFAWNIVQHRHGDTGHICAQPVPLLVQEHRARKHSEDAPQYKWQIFN